MVASERIPVLERLHELEGWAEYISEALHANQPLEPTTKAMIERVVEAQVLRQLRELSWTLRDKLHVLNVQLEHAH
jgi:hypothetical protein